jgi:hypothetical protein
MGEDEGVYLPSMSCQLDAILSLGFFFYYRLLDCLVIYHVLSRYVFLFTASLHLVRNKKASQQYPSSEFQHDFPQPRGRNLFHIVVFI